MLTMWLVNVVVWSISAVSGQCLLPQLQPKWEREATCLALVSHSLPLFYTVEQSPTRDSVHAQDKIY